MTLPLFPEPEEPALRSLSIPLRKLAERQIFVGTSSWKYEGWLGQVYDPARYCARGRFSRRRFEDSCLSEYCEVFPSTCGDFAFYQFPSVDFWCRLFSQVLPGFQFAFKVPEEITCKTFPSHPRYGARAGQDNPSFLDTALLQEAFLRPLEPYRRQIGVLIFEFGSFGQRAFEGVEQFLASLDPFMKSLPSGWRYAIEVRNKELPGPAILRLLALARCCPRGSTPGLACHRSNRRFKSAMPSRPTSLFAARC